MNITSNSQGYFYEQVIGGKLRLFVFLHVPSVRSDAMILTEVIELWEKLFGW